MSNSSIEAATTNGTSQGPTQAPTETFGAFIKTIKDYPIIFFGLFVGALVILITAASIVVYKKVSKRLKSGSTDIELLSSEASDTIHGERASNTSTRAPEPLHPSASATFLSEDISENENEIEPEYDYPELFQFRLQIEKQKSFSKSQEQSKRLTRSPKNAVHSYVNTDAIGQSEDSDCQYLIPRQFDPGDGTCGENLAKMKPYSEEPYYDTPSPELEDIPEIHSDKSPSGLRNGYVKVKSEGPRANVPRKAVSPKVEVIQELLMHFQKPAKKAGPRVVNAENADSQTNPSCHCSKTCRRNAASAKDVGLPELCRVKRHVADNGTDPLPTRKFPKKRYENLPALEW